MGSARSLTLIACFAASVISVAAHDGPETAASFDTRELTTHGPVGKAITHQAIRVTTERLEVGKQLTPNFARIWSSVGKGALIGFGIGSALGMTVGQEACLGQPRWHCAKVGVPVAVIGAAIAWFHK
jgi:hypothetical protein